MENITHSLFGLAIAGIALGNPEVVTTAERTTVVATAILGSNLPDADIVYRAFGKWEYLEHHRGWSHSIPAQVGGSALLAALGSLVSGLPFTFLFFYAALGVFLHVFIDFTNSYGTRVFVPWSPWRVAWDLVPTFDPVMAAILLLSWAAWATGFAPPRVTGIVTLLMVALWVLARFGLHSWAGKLAHNRSHGVKSVIPTIKPWTWRYVAHGDNGEVIQGEINLLHSRVIELGRLKANTEKPLIDLLRKNKEGSLFLNHSRHPHVELLQQTREGTSVLRVTDLAAQQSSAEIEVKGKPRYLESDTHQQQ